MYCTGTITGIPITGITHTHTSMIPGSMIHGIMIPGIMMPGITDLTMVLTTIIPHTPTLASITHLHPVTAESQTSSLTAV